ncbi:MAG: aminopeptidase [Desulfobacteraceae bacterium]|nr:aminopeptidase [Desulfobacteraceae bacterium]
MNKKEIEKLEKNILKKDKSAFDYLNKKETSFAFSFAEKYKTFLDNAKTEREAVNEIIKRAEAKGFININNALKKKSLKSKKFYKIFKGKTVGLAVLGKKPVENGLNIIASHIDSPRLDLKQNPLYEDLDLVLMKTHYYGGIRKYQWLNVPLALHGTIIKADGGKLDINIGEDIEDPIFAVSDLLPHLAGKLQQNKKVSDVFEGEKLNILCGSVPLGDDKIKNRFKLGVLKLLYDKYGIREEDFVSAEIEAVPAAKARDIGFDRSMIGAYGQDDRICAFTALEALFALKSPSKSAMALFFDKEEIGSEGNTGAKSGFAEDFVLELLIVNREKPDYRTMRNSILNSQCISADVNAAMDPDFKEVHDKMNAAKLGAGICITKYTGARGKSGASDASAELIGKIIKLLNKNKVVWQTGELGKVDEGGGGTLGKFLAESGMDVLDCGPSLLSMHSPLEISSKADLYMTYKGYKSFFAPNK